jgi:Zn finger protein HypA/HybF involved in hydrogenase expression
MRANKEFTIIPWKKQEESKLYFHCAQCRGVRMVRLADGLRCPNCGNTRVATRLVHTVENKK